MLELDKASRARHDKFDIIEVKVTIGENYYQQRLERLPFVYNNVIYDGKIRILI